MLISVIRWSDGSLTEIRTRHCSVYALNFAAERCPNLEVLSIKSCPNVTNDSMGRITFRCSELREIDISFCYELSNESLTHIGRNFSNVEVLKLNIMNWILPLHGLEIVPRVYLNAFPRDVESEADTVAKFMPNLEFLKHRFFNLTARGLASICEGYTKLEYLDLSDFRKLTSQDFADAASNLKNLKQFIKPTYFFPVGVFGFWL